MAKNGIKQTLVPPYHPASNGAAERCVRLVKEWLKKSMLGNEHRSLQHRLADFLLRYRTTPQSTTSVSPADLMCKRQFRTRLSCIKPNLAEHVERKQRAQKKDSCVKPRFFDVQDKVRVKNTVRKGNKFVKEIWIPGVIVKGCGPRNYIVKVGDRKRYVQCRSHNSKIR